MRIDPPWSSDPERLDLKHRIILELARIIGESDMDSYIKAVVGSYDDTLTDREVLDMARVYHPVSTTAER